MVVMMAESPTPSQSPPGIIPPWAVITVIVVRVRIRVRVGVIVVFPEMDLFAQDKRVSVIHIAQRFHLFPKDFTCHCNLLAFSVEVGV